MELVGLLVKIGIKADDDGRGGKRYLASYPDFNKLSVVKGDGIDWAYWVDRKGGGWHYDKALGHKEEGTDSPYGMQWGMLLVPEAFADQAVQMFDKDVEELGLKCAHMSNAECIDFYDNKAHAHEPKEHTDEEAIASIGIRASLGKSYKAAQKAKMLNPDDPTPGIRKNHRKTFALMSAHTGITLKPEPSP